MKKLKGKSLWSLITCIAVVILMSVTFSCTSGGGGGGGGGGGFDNWTVSVVDDQGDTGLYTSLKFDPDDVPRISYYNATNGDLVLSSLLSGDWTTVLLEGAAGDQGLYTSQAIDNEGVSHISYFNLDISVLHYITANTAGPLIPQETIPDPDSTDYGEFSSIALDEGGIPTISYYDAQNGVLKVVTVGFNPVTVDSAGDVGQYSSIAFNPQTGFFGVAYYDVTNFDLKFAYYTGVVWVVTTVDTAGDVGQYASLVFDNDGIAHISYYDATNDSLKHASANSATPTDWFTESVDSAGNVGQFTSIGIGAGGLRISYYDVTNAQLKYARQSQTSGTWTNEVVDTNDNVGLFSSLDFDSQGFPGISYYDATNGRLKFARNTSNP